MNVSAAMGSTRYGPNRPAFVPISVKDFMNWFLDYPHSSGSLSEDGIAKITDCAAREPASVYPILVNELNKSACAKEFRFFLISSTSEQPYGSTTPQVVLYPVNVPNYLYTNKAGSAFLHLGSAEMLIETGSIDPFYDPPHDVPEDSSAYPRVPDFLDCCRDKAAATLLIGRVVANTIELCARQYRLSCFVVFIFGTHARFMRWDRSGFVLSRSFDYCEDSWPLSAFFERYRRASSNDRGYDTKVRLALKGEEKLFKNVLVRYILNEVIAYPGCSSGGPSASKAEKASALLPRHYEKGRVFVVRIGNERFLVSRSAIQPRSTTSRGTCGYWAVNNISEEVVFLTDNWRYDSLDTLPPRDLTKHLDDPVAVAELTAMFAGEAYRMSGDPRPVRPRNIDAFDEYREKLMIQRARAERMKRFPPASWVRFRPPREAADSDAGRAPERKVLQVEAVPGERLRGTYDLLSGTGDIVKTVIELHKVTGKSHGDVSLNNFILRGPAWGPPE